MADGRGPGGPLATYEFMREGGARGYSGADRPTAKPSAAPVREQVAAGLRVAIAGQRFVPGQRLREKEICSLTGASRTAVREALRQLESEGLVEVIPHRGPIVAEMTLRDAEEIYELRMALEGLAARLFARKASTGEMATLRATVELIAHADGTQGADTAEPLSLKRRFYDILLAGAGNELVQKSLAGLLSRVTVLRATSLGQPGRLGRTVEELRAILTAIESRDEDAAEAACRAHVLAAARVAIATMGGDPDRAFPEPAAGRYSGWNQTAARQSS